MPDKDRLDGDFFSQINKWLDLGCEYNTSVIDDALDYVVSPGKRVGTLLDGFSSLSKSLLRGSPDSSGKILENQFALMGKQLELAESIFERLAGNESAPVARPEAGDRRFSDSEWESNALFDYIKQSYLLNSQALKGAVDCLGLDETDKERVDYYMRQISSALSPSNFPMTNPEIVRKIKESKGQSLYNGIKLLIEDQKKSGDYLNVCMSDDGDFKLGDNLAATPGQVIFENNLMQLIQYKPNTSQVQQVPLLIISSWVNKFYILDLREKNSFVKWAVDQGFTVFMISWLNPDASYRDVRFDDYLETGVLTAVDQVKKAANVEQVGCIGYCLGGILLATALGYLAKKDDDSIAFGTYLASSLDFNDPGAMRVFIDEATVDGLEKEMDEKGFLDGRSLSVSFCMLRENELYWNYFIQNYLMGERPSAFDILYWNADSTNVPATTHKFVLEDLHLKNGLMKKDEVSLLGQVLDLSLVDTPVYVLATEKDHIAKWQSTYSATQLHRGKCRFILAGSGHIAGVVNPPASQKYHYYSNQALPGLPEQWWESAVKHKGSWWNDWVSWAKTLSGELIDAREIDESLVIESAPGRYVKRRLDNVETGDDKKVA